MSNVGQTISSQSRLKQRLPLYLLLAVPFIIQILVVVGITGWLSYQSGQRSVDNLASELLVQAKYRIKERLDRFLGQAQSIVQTNAFAFEKGHISLDQDLQLQDYFWQQIRRYQPAPQAIYVGDARGRTLEVNRQNQLTLSDRTNVLKTIFYPISPQGKRQPATGSEHFDPRPRPWYQQASQYSEPIWTPSYLFTTGRMGISAAQAIRGRDDAVLAVTAIDLSLAELDTYLRSIQIGRSSKTFIMERSGLLVANSISDSVISKPDQNGKKIPQRISVESSETVLIRESAKHLRKEIGSLYSIQEPLSLEFSIQNERHFLSVLPYQFGNGLNWLVAIVVPEQEFTHQIEDNNRTTLLLCLLSLLLAIAVGVMTSRSLSRKILQLAQAADSVVPDPLNSDPLNSDPLNSDPLNSDPLNLTTLTPTPLPNSNSHEMSVLVNSFDRMVVRLKGVFQDLEEFAYVDALTGLPNRAAFLVRLDYALMMAKQTNTPSFAVLLLNIDSFKMIENGLGTAMGDLLLNSVAYRLHECFQSVSVCTVDISRLEQDEFAILLSHLSQESDVITAAQRIVNAFQKPFRLSQQDVFVSACIGVAIDRGEFEKPEDVLYSANLAKLGAKDRGKGQYVVFDTLMRHAMVERLQLEADLQYAIAREEFELWYQPIISLNPDQVAGFEALIRWRHPTEGFLSPLKFIPLAEQTGAIVEMGMWIMRTACHQMKAWQGQHPALQSAFVSVNVSAQQLLLSDFVERVAGILQETELNGQYLQLEITEGAAVSQPSAISPKLEQLRNLGLKICIDDFGTGYSHLSYLIDLPINALKIDRSFVNNIGSSKNKELAKTILALSTSLDIDATAEGVETEVQFNHLRSLHCAKFQGYLFAAPLSVDHAAQFQPVIPEWVAVEEDHHSTGQEEMP